MSRLLSHVHIPPANEDQSAFEVISRTFPGFLADLPRYYITSSSGPSSSVVNKDLSFKAKAKAKDLTKAKAKAKDLTSEHVQGPL